MTTIAGWITFIAALSGVAWCAFAETPTTVPDETASALPAWADQIAIPSSPAPAMAFAAADLANYLALMTGDEYAIAEHLSSPRRARIVLGCDDRLAPDAYRVKRTGEQVRIMGGSGRGCLFGVYAWLGDLGCRWPLPGDEYESIPTVTGDPWSGPTLAATPAVRRRGMVYCLADDNDTSVLDRVDFLAKNGFNYLFVHIGSLSPTLQTKLAAMLNEREMGFEYGGHLLPAMLPRELFDDHPAYFRMEDGQRTAHLNMCPSSDAAAAIIADNARKQYLEPLGKEFDHLETLHLWPDDLFGGGWCTCPLCGQLTESEQSLLILNKVAEHLGPGSVMLGHCAYHSSIRPPARVEGHPRVRLMYAPRERSYRYPLDGCSMNNWYYECLKGLVRAVPNQPEVFEYYHDCVLFRFLPMPLHPIIGPDIEAYRKAGIDGIASLSFSEYDRWAYGPNTYVLGRCLWRGRGDRSDIETYCDAVYGPGGPAMVKYFDGLHALCATAMDTCGYRAFIDLRQLPPNVPALKDHTEQLETLASKAKLDAIEAHLRQAMSVTEEPYRIRAAEQWPLWQFTRQEIHTILRGFQACPHIHAALEKGSSPQQQKRAITLLEELIAQIDKGTAILRSVPRRLKGAYASDGVGTFEERKTAYQINLNAWLETLQQRQASQK